MWCDGTIEGKYRRESLKTRSWERATALARAIEDGTSGQVTLTFQAATDLYLADCEARNLQPVTLRKLKLITRTLADFGPKLLKDIDAKCLREFRASWKDAPITQTKKVERLRSIFKWFVDADMLPKNPAAGLKNPLKHETAVEPFSPEQQAKIIETAYRLARTQEHGPKQFPVNPKTGIFTKLLLASALRITDAAMLTKDRIQSGRLFLYATKNKKPVTLPLPPDLLRELEAIPSHQLFASPEGSQRGETVSDYWRDQLIKVFKAAEISDAHPHRFRHSVAVNMLDAGSSVEDVALVLGNSPAIVSKHYSAFVQSRQDRIDREIQKTWGVKPKLVRVK